MNYHRSSLLVAALLMLNNLALPAQIPDWLWIERSGGSGIDAGNSITADNSGAIYVSGTFSDTADFSGTVLMSRGRSDIFLSRYDVNGNLLWVAQGGGSEFDYAAKIASDNLGTITLSGSFSGVAIFADSTLTSNGDSDCFVASYSENGSLLWIEQAGGQDLDLGAGIAVDGNGNRLLTGQFSANAIFGDTTLTSAGSGDIFLAKYDDTGDLLWARRAGGIFSDSGADVAVDNQGNIFVTGRFFNEATFGDTTLSGSWREIFLAKYDPNGELLWVESAGGAGDFDRGIAVALDEFGNSYITGHFSDVATFGDTTLSGEPSTIFLAKYDADGNLKWVEQASGTAADATFASDVDVDESGNTILTGNFGLTVTFGDTTLIGPSSLNIFIASYDTDGVLHWAMQAGGNDRDLGQSIAYDGSENALVTGMFSTSVLFGDTTVHSVGDRDIFVGKLGNSITGNHPFGNLPGRMTLHQNYPNPFNPSTTIGFAIPKSGHLTLTIYNILGQPVATLVNERLHAGSYEYRWHAGDLAGGVYFYRLEAGEFIETKKLLLVR